MRTGHCKWQKVAAKARVGETVLIRLLNASYSILRVTFQVPVFSITKQ